MISYTTTRLLRCTSYLRFHFFPSPPLPLRLMSWRLSEIACARSASEVISIASNISLDILSLSPPRTSGLLTDPGDHGRALPYERDPERDSDGGLSPNRIPPANCGDACASLPRDPSLPPLLRGSARGV